MPPLPVPTNKNHRTGKGQFSFQFQRKGNAKECSNYHTIALISHASKVMLKILQARLQQFMNGELPDVQTVFAFLSCDSDGVGIHALSLCFEDSTEMGVEV